MKKLDSSDVLLLLYIGFLLVVLLGLTLQSCRSVRLDKSNQTTSRTDESHKNMQIDDHVSLSELAQSWIDDKRIIIRDYAVVIDSSGNTIPVLEKETEISHNKTYQRDSSSVNFNNKTTIDDHSSSNITEENEMKSVDKEPLFSFSNYSLIISFALLVFLIYYSYRRFSS